ncbi:MAG: ABC transporter ATP-binding protein [Treponema sp.]|nr:ABC transporter ATP-binding protein [Treponema sp.]
MAVISLQDVHKSYPMGKQTIEAVKGISFKVEKGEFAAISGPSGSGKSTLLNMIGLIDLPSSGSIIIGDTDVYKDVKLESKKIDRYITALRRSHLGFIFQTFNLIPVLNVYENIEFPLLLKSKNPASKSPVDDFTSAQKAEWINYLIDKVGLSQWKNHKATELSGGQRQRVAIARALVTKAPLILADEPTANLDSTNSAQILSLMKALNKDPDLQTTFIFSTHDSRIVDMCDHVVHILDGKVINDEYKTGSDVYKL